MKANHRLHLVNDTRQKITATVWQFVKILGSVATILDREVENTKARMESCEHWNSGRENNTNTNLDE